MIMLTLPIMYIAATKSISSVISCNSIDSSGSSGCKTSTAVALVWSSVKVDWHKLISNYPDKSGSFKFFNNPLVVEPIIICWIPLIILSLIAFFEHIVLDLSQKLQFHFHLNTVQYIAVWHYFKLYHTDSRIKRVLFAV